MKTITKYICKYCSREYESETEADKCQNKCEAEDAVRLKEETDREKREQKAKTCDHDWVYVQNVKTEYGDSGYPPREYVTGIIRQCKKCYSEESKCYSRLPATADTWKLLPDRVFKSDLYVKWGHLNPAVKTKLNEEKEV